MVFRVEVTARAEVDIAEAVDCIAADSPTRARTWLAGLIASFELLQNLPTRHDLIAEAPRLRRDLRSIQHHSHRVVYEVDEVASTVFIVRIYHGARRSLGPKDL